ncbi:sigma-54 interaction domain-containing protein [Paradesulfitobacterium ferrireducens]|uniref:sigma-54 interaction domain-containing protein n=1 Tax=Paradesulfitobacterium ferrireducens TaxID=2816476 RepID=UPI001A8E633B|nr:sigma 54-interacting transcriptional regulator [Paradesulfitobacterium ferrireducens]
MFPEKITFEQFQKILNALSDGVYISDATGNTLWLNRISENIVGKTNAEVVGRNVRDLEAEGIFNPSVTRLTLDAGKTISTVQSMDNGRKYLVTGNLIRDDQGKIILVVAQSRDITEAIRTTVQLEEAEALLRQYSQEIRDLKNNRDKVDYIDQIVGHSSSYLPVLDLIERVSMIDTTVLITGETGVGKTVLAKRIHELSDRHDKPFVHINCGAIAESLIESELFGYKKGAFTGANTSGKIGLVKSADGGTLFLDEIGELPLHLQSKLLQFLQEKKFIPVGDTQVQTADVRIIAATNSDLSDMVSAGRFRPDLYYRLNIVPIAIPPLRERPEDVFPLLYHFLTKFNKQHRQNRRFSTEVLDLLQMYDWPGNIRELENLVERLVITAKMNEISVTDLPERIRKQKPAEERLVKMLEGESMTQMLWRIEKELLEEAYRIHGNTRKTANALGITQSLLMRRFKRYGIRPLTE